MLNTCEMLTVFEYILAEFHAISLVSLRKGKDLPLCLNNKTCSLSHTRPYASPTESPLPIYHITFGFTNSTISYCLT